MKEKRYFAVAKVRNMKIIQTGIASLDPGLEVPVALPRSQTEVCCVCSKESPIGRYVLGNGGSPIAVNP